MATIYINDDLLMRYAAEYGSPDEAKAEIQEIVEDNAPGGDDG